MKMAKLTLAGWFLIAAPIAFAQADPDFDKLDLNGDGALSMAEARRAGLADRFQKLDTSRDGRVTREEFAAAAASKEEGSGSD
jgi:hypothetical protein